MVVDTVTDLSVILPARNEQFLRRTVEDVLANIEADTEIIVVSSPQSVHGPDGPW